MLFAARPTFAAHPKLARDLEGGDPEKTADVIVQFHQTPSAKHHQKVRQMAATHKASLQLVKGAVYSVPAGKLAELADDPNVAYISPDRPVQGSLNYAVPAVGADIAQNTTGTEMASEWRPSIPAS